MKKSEPIKAKKIMTDAKIASLVGAFKNVSISQRPPITSAALPVSPTTDLIRRLDALPTLEQLGSKNYNLSLNK